MNHREAKHIACSLLCVLGLFLVGCGDADDGERYGEWTMKEASLPLTEDLSVSETENFYFGTASDLDVTADGKIVVADRQANNLKVLRPDGSLLDTLGGAGEGPGEFQTLASVQVGRGDSLYAYDIRRSRLTVFGPATPYSTERTLTLSREKGFAINLRVMGDSLLAEYSAPISAPKEGVSRPSSRTWRWVHGAGTSGDTILSHRGARMATTQSGNEGFVVRTIPFERTMETALGPEGKLYYGWTDSLHIQARTPTTDPEVIASVPTEPTPITEADRDSALSDIDDELRSMVASALPETKPAFTDLVVDDTGALWVKRPAQTADAETVSWWILKPESKTIRTTQLPADVEIDVVRNGHAYGTTTTEMGAPAVVRYTIPTET